MTDPDDPVTEPVEDLTSQVIPKKIPAVDDIDGQTRAVGGALASALLTATDVPLHVLESSVGALAAQMVAFGIRQTDSIDAEAIHAPAWIVDGMRQKSMRVPEQPDHHAEEPAVARTAEAPPVPDEIPAVAQAVSE